MSVTEQSDLQETAARHLWMNFSPVGRPNARAETPIMVRAEGCYVWDESGKRYLDALSSLFCVNIGHGRADVAAAAAEQGDPRVLPDLGCRPSAGDQARAADRRAGARRSEPRVLHQRW